MDTFSENIMFGNSRILEIEHFANFGKDACRTIPTIRLIFVSEILDVGSISIKKHEMGIWEFLNMGFISSREYESEI